MAPEQPDGHRHLDGGTDPTEPTTADWARFGPARDDLGNELDPHWRDWFDPGPDPLDDVPVPPSTTGPDPVDDGERTWLGVRWRRIGIPIFVVGAIWFGLGGWLFILDVSRARSQGTAGTFELDDCRYQRERRRHDAYHCRASFTDTRGRVRSPVRVTVADSLEEGGTTRTGWLRGDHGYGDDVRLPPRILLQLLGIVVVFFIALGAVRKERNRNKPTPPRDDPFAWP